MEQVFISEITSRAFIVADSNKRRTLSRSDIAKALSKSDQFDFLIDIVPRDESYQAGGVGVGAGVGGASSVNAGAGVKKHVGAPGGMPPSSSAASSMPPPSQSGGTVVSARAQSNEDSDRYDEVRVFLYLSVFHEILILKGPFFSPKGVDMDEDTYAS